MYTADRSPEQVLIMRSQRGETNAYRALLERYVAPLYTLALRMTGENENAQAAVREAFLSAWRSLVKFDIQTSFLLWLTRLTLDSAALVQKKTPSPPQADAEGMTLEAYRRLSLEYALLTLTENHRKILLLREGVGLNYHEIGTVLELTPGTVKSRLSRARRELREKLFEIGHYFAPAPVGSGKAGESCGDYAVLISASLDDALTDTEKFTLERHLADCPFCRRIWEEFSVLQNDLSESEALPTDFENRLMTEISKTEQEIPFTNLSPDRNADQVARERVKNWWRPIRTWLLVAAAVAVILILGILISRSVQAYGFDAQEGERITESALSGYP